MDLQNLCARDGTRTCAISGKIEDIPLEVMDDDVATKDNETLCKQSVVFIRKLHHLLAFITDESAKLVVRQNTSGNGFETWRLLYQKFTLPGTSRDVGLLSQMMTFSFSSQHFPKDFDRHQPSPLAYAAATSAGENM